MARIDHGPLPLRPLRVALETLLAPLESPDAEDWRDAVCRGLRTLTDTDIAFFRLSDDSPSRIDPPGPLPARDAYRREFRSLDPWPRCAVAPGQTHLDTHENLIGPRQLQRDVYYNEFMRPFGVLDYVGVQVGTTPGEHAHLGIFNSGRSRGTAHHGETVRRLRAVLPALQTGLRAWLMTRHQPDRLQQMLDQLGDPLALCDTTGRVLHVNRALADVLASDPSETRLREALERAVRLLGQLRTADAVDLLGAVSGWEVTTPLGTYRIRNVKVDQLASPGGGVLLIVDPPRRVTPDNTSPRERFGLTPREVEVANLLALGHDNETIAARLNISAATARNHTARVLAKLGVRSRAGVHAILHPSR